MEANIGNSIFQGAGVNIDNAGQNLEEEEELEDQKRRQEEIKSLLTKAMDDFNYDDQSTINSSANASVDYIEAYKEVPLNNQLEILYNIRVKEVESLSQKLNSKEQELSNMKSLVLQKLMIAEAENETLKTTLKNSQELMVEKCNQLQHCKDEKTSLLFEMDILKKYLSKMETEKNTIEYNNKDLTERIAILENGHGANPLSGVAMQEAYNHEVSKLQSNLDTAYFKIQRLEQENQDLTVKVNNVTSQKEDLIANKSEVINKLMQNLDQAQEHNRELLENVTHSTAENELLKKHVHELESSMKLMKGFTDKTEIIKILQKELEKCKSTNSKQVMEYDNLSKEYSDLMREMKTKNAQIQLLEDNITKLECKASMDSNSIQTSNLMESTSVSAQLRDELMVSKDILERNEATITFLQQKIQILEEDVISLNKKLQLSAQRDKLTIELQEKATKLEEIILNNQKPPCESKSTNTDPDPEKLSQDLYELYRTKFESELIEKEVKLRKELQIEFDRNYNALKENISKCIRCEHLSQELETKVKEAQQLRVKIEESLNKSFSTCKMCSEMSTNLMKNVEVMQTQEAQLEQYRINQEKDREVIVTVLEEWKKRFQTVEMENQALKEKLEGALTSYSRAQAELSLIKTSELQLVEAIRTKAQAAVRSWSAETLQQVRIHNQKIKTTKERIDNISMKADCRIKEIEEQFNKVQLDMKYMTDRDVEFNKIT